MKKLSKLKKILLLVAFVTIFFLISFFISYVQSKAVIVILGLIWCIIAAAGLHKLVNRFFT